MPERTCHLQVRDGLPRRHRPASVPARRVRRGAIAAIVGLLMVGMVGIAALAIDFGRLENLKADVQTSADAAALAGAIELIPIAGHDANQALNVAQNFALANPAMQATVTVVSRNCGIWDDFFGFGFINLGNLCGISNAVQITVSRQSSGLFMSALGVSAPNVRATATASYLPATCLLNPSTCRVFLVTPP